MSFIGSNKDIKARIERNTAMQSPFVPILIAVAYWGEGIDDVILDTRMYRIICNLSDGGTNPKVIKSLIQKDNVQIKQLEYLHAKIILTEKKAIVGSSNFSKNGLGLDGCEGTIEAALETGEVDDLITWFEIQWSSASEITEASLNDAERNFNKQNLKPASQAIAIPQKELTELELFKEKITGNNKIRMANSRLENLHYEKENLGTDDCKKRASWVPAHAANLIWVTSGQTIKTKIIECREFRCISDVIDRMMQPRIETEKKVLPFLNILSNEKKFSPELRYWAKVAYQNLSEALED